MNPKILHKDVQQFIQENLKSDITKLILKGSPFDGISIQELANQVVAKQKSLGKLPTWFNTENIYYPPKISIEQTSSEITAKYKSSLISGDKIIDITGGFGIDCFYFSKQFKEVSHCEINEELSTIVKHNYQQLKAENITTISGNGLDFLKNTNHFFDCIYVDPSRRSDVKGKVFLLKDCLPYVPPKIDFFFTKAKHILIKVSPILDIKNTTKDLKNVKEVHIVAINNDVKELLFLLEKDYENAIKIKTINFQKNGSQKFEFDFTNSVESTYSEPLTYLYEPNSAILKSGGFHHISNQLRVFKLHQHSHLYTSDQLIDFPGRRFKIEHIISYDKKKLRKILPYKKANITSRNFPKTVAQFRKETKIKDGGEVYIFLTTDLNNNHKLVICKKVNINLSYL
ncbi:SAM-dependent methyltransferase [Polaribacter reichenbachii]|uniref:SAM-dependent methyltransferase n=1 Tax=Polaribacter reichenbachii TaxID=996801 RepID=A0A1B8U428_9FLAO|nr:class I SAM-dependent methyltransferase [Polaribacter reichenbachii]APZ47912.1 SAM-dependent methyltransferase [Polaribacter reichenbachii]AUC18544.1 SAM-dependent methyltransferase [Polaribacter reichenbachii]OBY66614.1 SAM-dependent methyltransferase [Polaribacter reichenbachii]